MTGPRLAWLASAALIIAGCPGSLEDPERFGAGPGECDAEELLASTCGSNAVCHDADAPQGGLDFASPGVQSRVIDVSPGLCVMSNSYVDSMDPSASFILEKINPSPGCGSQMPPAPETPLTPEEVECITDWVFEITGGSTSGDAGAGDGGGMDDAGAGDGGDGAMP